jgi:hypothetical protein
MWQVKTNVLSGKLSFKSFTATSEVHNGIIYSKSNTSKIQEHSVKEISSDFVI